jgi:hypothetical protein
VTRQTTKYFVSICFFINVSILSAPITYGTVIAFDNVTTVHTPIYLKALTKGRFFAQGGKLVFFYIAKNQIGRTLSGGDGYAYLKFNPQHIGIKQFEVISNKEKDTGLVLTMGKRESAIMVEIVGGLRESLFSSKPKDGAQMALTKLISKYRIIYLSKAIGTSYLKEWLKKEEFPSSVVLAWRGPELLETLKERGIVLYAIIGSTDLLSGVSKRIEKRYTFEETEEAKTVSDWKEILKDLTLNPLP